MEDDYLTWKSKVLPLIAHYFGITADMAKALRSRPHLPLFVNVLLKDNPKEKTYFGEHSTTVPRRWQANKLTKDAEDYDIIHSSVKYKEVTKKFGYDVKNPFYSPLLVSKPLFQESWESFSFPSNVLMPTISDKKSILIEKEKLSIARQCYHVELDISDSGLRYQTGDHVGTWPENDPKEVIALAQALKLTSEEMEQIFEFKPHPDNPLSASAKLPFPMPCSIRTALTHYLDLQSVVKQYQMEILAKFASNKTERDRLLQLADDRSLFLSLIEKPQKNLRHILQEFTSVHLPVEVVLGELLPRVGLRYYSISSSAKEDPQKVTLTAVVVRYALQTPGATANTKKDQVVLKQGLATSWLERLHQQKQVNPIDSPPFSYEHPVSLPKYHLPIYIRTSSFKLPKQTILPVILIGPGTGIAPFRGFVRERLLDAKEGKAVGPTWLFYGCRHEQQVMF
jgi:NADPH-ferrihemoprotein reductase